LITLRNLQVITGNTLNCPADNRAKKKVLSGCLGQVDFPSEQVTFHSHLPPVDKGSGKSSARPCA